MGGRTADCRANKRVLFVINAIAVIKRKSLNFSLKSTHAADRPYGFDETRLNTSISNRRGNLPANVPRGPGPPTGVTVLTTRRFPASRVIFVYFSHVQRSWQGRSYRTGNPGPCRPGTRDDVRNTTRIHTTERISVNFTPRIVVEPCADVSTRNGRQDRLVFRSFRLNHR